MKPNSRQLTMRDPALAAIVGALAGGDFGSDFGGEFGDELEDALADYGVDFGDDDEDFEDDEDEYAGDFGAAVNAAVKAQRRRSGGMMKRPTAAMVRKPSVNGLAAMWASRQLAQSRTQQRAKILEPNKGSSVKVERYAFSISQALTLGTLAPFTTLTGQPDTAIRPQRVTCNAPSMFFAFIQEIKVANVSVTVGTGLEDAFNYNANGVGQSLDMPTLSPANRATVLGSYTGFVPPGFTIGQTGYFSVTFKGPASIVA